MKSTFANLRSGLNHGFETSIRQFQEQLKSRLLEHGCDAEELPEMIKRGEEQFRDRSYLFDFKIPGNKALRMRSRSYGKFNLQVTEYGYKTTTN